MPLTPGEELRRQLSCLLSIKEEQRRLTADEMDEVWHTIGVAEGLRDSRTVGICLEIIKEQVLRGGCSESEIQWEAVQRVEEAANAANKAVIKEIRDRVANPAVMAQSAISE